jgi:uncharacterized phage infection (PIP) family protein YhgE
MSEEALARIESTLEDLVAGQSRLTEGQATLEGSQATLTTGLEEVRLHLIRVDRRLERVDTRLDKLEVTQELMRDDIKQIAEGHGATQAAIARSTEAVIAHIDKRIDPLEEAVRARVR